MQPRQGVGSYREPQLPLGDANRYSITSVYHHERPLQTQRFCEQGTARVIRDWTMKGSTGNTGHKWNNHGGKSPDIVKKKMAEGKQGCDGEGLGEEMN